MTLSSSLSSPLLSPPPLLLPPLLPLSHLHDAPQGRPAGPTHPGKRGESSMLNSPRLTSSPRDALAPCRDTTGECAMPRNAPRRRRSWPGAMRAGCKPSSARGAADAGLQQTTQGVSSDTSADTRRTLPVSLRRVPRPWAWTMTSGRFRRRPRSWLHRVDIGRS